MRPKFSESFVDSCLQCPACGGDYLHQKRVDVFFRAEDAEEGFHAFVTHNGTVVNHSMAGNPSSRRSGISIGFWCENCDAIPFLTIVQHKGNTFIDISHGIAK